MEQSSILYSSIFLEYPDVVSTKDVSRMLGIGRNRAYELVHSEMIKKSQSREKDKGT